MLDEDAEEAFDGAEEGAVDHDGLVGLAVFAGVFELEALREVEVELDGGELPHAAEDVDEFDVDLGAVEGGFAGDGLEGEAAFGEDVMRERSLDGCAQSSGVPMKSLLPGSDPRWRARRLILGLKPKVLRTASAKSMQASISAFDLVAGAEDVGVVLREAAHAQQAVHGAGALVAVDVAELGVAHGQVAIALRRRSCR